MAIECASGVELCEACQNVRAVSLRALCARCALRARTLTDGDGTDGTDGRTDLPPDPPDTGFCSLAADFDRRLPSAPAHSTSSSALRSFCSASGRLNLRTRRSIRDLRSISPFFFHVFSALTLLVGALRVHTGGIGPGLDAWEVPTTFS